MNEKVSDTKAAEKQRGMWIILGVVAALIGLGLWLAGRKNPNFNAEALRRKFFGGSGKG